LSQTVTKGTPPKAAEASSKARIKRHGACPPASTRAAAPWAGEQGERLVDRGRIVIFE
jgi:hypothetical protein